MAKATPKSEPSTQNLESIVSSLKDIIFELTPAGIFTNVWVANESALFYPKKNYLGKSLHELFPEDFCKPIMACIQQTIDSGERTTLEYSGRPFSDRWYRATFTILKGTEANEKKRIIKVVEDITDERATLIRLRESEERHRMVLRASQDAISDWQKPSNNVIINERFSQILGVPQTETVPTLTFLSWVHDEDRDLMSQLIQGQLSNPQGLGHKIRFKSKDGSLRILLSSSYVQRDSQGMVQRVVMSHRDVTALEYLQEEMALQSEFSNTILNQLPVAVFTKDVENEFRFAFWNKKAEQILGLSEAEVLGKNDYDFFPREQADFFRAKDLETISRGKRVQIEEEPIDSKSNGRRWLRTIKVPIFDSSGKATYLLGITTDITDERVSVMRAKTLSSMVEQSQDFFAYADLSGKPLYLNKSVVENLGYDLNVPSMLDFVDSSMHSVYLGEVFPTVAGSGKDIEIESLFINKKTGERVPVRQRLFPIRNEKGEALFIAMVASDLRSRKQLESRVANSTKLASLGEMAGGVAHEINNPLAIIQGKAQQMQRRIRESPLQTDAMEADINKILETTARISKIVRGLRSFARDGSRDPMLDASVNEIVDNVLELSRERFKNGGVQIKISLKQDFHIQCRQVEIEQVLLNLLNNSYDAINGSKEPWISIEAKREGDEAIAVSVTDSGKGIPTTLKDRIMEPFFTTKDLHKGTGLGLSISKGIIEQHQGKFFLDAKCDHTRFVFILPIKQKAHDLTENKNHTDAA